MTGEESSPLAGPLTHQQSHVEMVALLQELGPVAIYGDLHLQAARRSGSGECPREPSLTPGILQGGAEPLPPGEPAGGVPGEGLTASSICSGVTTMPTPHSRSKSAVSMGSSG